MTNSIGKPSEEVEKGVLMRRKDIAEVGTIKDIFQCGQDADPDWWPPIAWNKSVIR